MLQLADSPGGGILRVHPRPRRIGNTRRSTDRPLQPGIQDARRQGGTIVWCHNTYGYEDVPHTLAGRLDALNVFDGSRRDSYADTYYRFLNIGLRVPLSTGTDWFLYDFARVYARKRGRTPAKAVEAIRLDAARRRLEETEDRIASIAEQCGFGSEEQMRLAFLRALKIPPRDYRKRFSSPTS